MRQPSLKNNSTFIRESINKYGGIFDYSLTKYINAKTPVHLICKIHGGFKQTPNCHLVSKYGCPKCSLEGRAKTRTKPLQVVLKEFYNIHADVYDYSKVTYKGTTEKVVIICKEHGEFLQTPDAHLTGRGCRECAKSKREEYAYEGKSNYIIYHNKPTILYYIRFIIENESFYKIGITTKPLTKRFYGYPAFDMISISKFNTGREAFTQERSILKKFRKYKYLGLDVLPAGNTELFTKNILLQPENFKQGGNIK